MLIQFGRVGLMLSAAVLALSVPATGAEPTDTEALETIVSIDPIRLERDGDAPVTVRITAPQTGDSLGLVVLSHGNQLSRTDYDPLVRYLARHGYIVVQPDHPDASVEGLMPAGPQPADAWLIRARQLEWLAAHIDAVGKSAPLIAGRIDLKRVAVIGHSFGGQSASLVMGATAKAVDQTFDAPAYRAAILLAPPGNFDGLTPDWKRRAPYLAMDWSTMRGPVLTINGSADSTALTDQGPKWHDDPWLQARAGRTMCLMTIDAAGHYLGGIDSFLRLPQGDATRERREHIFSTVVAFLDSALSPAKGAGFAAAHPDLKCK